MGFKEDIERDWGDPDIYGPWTKELEKYYVPFPPGWFKFYKSYYLITYKNDRGPKIDCLHGYNDLKPEL